MAFSNFRKYFIRKITGFGCLFSVRLRGSEIYQNERSTRMKKGVEITLDALFVPLEAFID